MLTGRAFLLTLLVGFACRETAAFKTKESSDHLELQTVTVDGFGTVSVDAQSTPLPLKIPAGGDEDMQELANAYGRNAKFFIVVGNGRNTGFAPGAYNHAVEDILNQMAKVKDDGYYPVLFYFGDGLYEQSIGLPIDAIANSDKFKKLGGKLAMIQIDLAVAKNYKTDDAFMDLLAQDPATGKTKVDPRRGDNWKQLPGEFFHANYPHSPEEKKLSISEFGGIKSDFTPAGNTLKWAQLQLILQKQRRSITKMLIIGDGGLITWFEVLFAMKLKIPRQYYTAQRKPDGKDTVTEAHAAFLCKYLPKGVRLQDIVETVRKDRSGKLNGGFSADFAPPYPKC